MNDLLHENFSTVTDYVGEGVGPWLMSISDKSIFYEQDKSARLEGDVVNE